MFKSVKSIALVALTGLSFTTGTAFAGDNGSGLQPAVPSLGCAVPCTTASSSVDGKIVYGPSINKATGDTIRTAAENNERAARQKAQSFTTALN